MRNQHLELLDSYPHRETYAKIISWDANNASDKKSIGGRITAGSLNVDGSSSIRRTLSLTLTRQFNEFNGYGELSLENGVYDSDSNSVKIDDVWLDYNRILNTRIKIEIGLKNFIGLSEQNLNNVKNVYLDPETNIIWFNQGVFICNSYSISQNANSFTINIQGKDLMCLLNGELGGVVESNVDFGTFDQIDNEGNVINFKIPVSEIIKEAVHHYGNIDYNNIKLYDIPDYGYALKEYRYDKPLYLFRLETDEHKYEYVRGTLNGEIQVACNGDDSKFKLSELQDEAFDNFVPDLIEGKNFRDGSVITYNGTNYYVHRIDFGETAGYEQTPLVYNSDLIAKPGETIDSAVLTKIKNMLGDYEYFFNIDGDFVFQKKAVAQLYKDDDELLESVYVFPTGKTMFTAFNNTPQIANIKNDFSIWGQRKGVSGAKIDIHGRFALQEKPTSYIPLTDLEKEDARNEFRQTYKKELTAEGGNLSQIENTSSSAKWREIIYQMAKDYNAFGHTQVYANSAAAAEAKKYQPYFTDMLGFWRQLYCPPGLDAEKVNGIEYDSDGWNTQVRTTPWMLNFWIDFFNYKDTDYEAFCIDKIGYRPKVSNDTSVKAISYSGVPELVFYEGDRPTISDSDSKHYFNISIPVDKMFSTSTQGRTVFNAAESMKLQHLECAEDVSITSVPIFHLQPNSIVTIEDEQYFVSKLTVPLTYNGTMSITATKVIKILPTSELVEPIGGKK